MKNMKKFFAIAVLGLTFASCSVTYPYTATNNPIGSKTGTSETVMLFGVASGTTLSSGLVFNSNYGVIEAARNGGLNKVATVDVKVTNYYIFQKAEIIVTGE